MPPVAPVLPGPDLATLAPTARSHAVWLACTQAFAFLQRVHEESYQLLKHDPKTSGVSWDASGVESVRTAGASLPRPYCDAVFTYLRAATTASIAGGYHEWDVVAREVEVLLAPALAQATVLGAQATRAELELWLQRVPLPPDARAARAFLVFSQTILLAALPSGQWSGADLLRLLPRLPYRQQLLDQVTGLLDRDEDWTVRPLVVRYLEEILALPRPAGPKAAQATYDRLRRAITDVLIRQEAYPDDSPEGAANARGAATLLTTYLRDTSASTAPLTPAELAAVPWARGDQSPTVADARLILARLTVPDYRTRMSTKDLEPALQVVRAIASTPRTAHLVVSDVWPRATTPAARATLLFHADLLARDGPWWFDAAWRQAAFETLSTLPDTFVPPQVTPALRGVFTLTVGQVPVDLWFRAAARWATLATARPDFLRDILETAGASPTWRPSPEALLPFLHHAEVEIRQLAQCAVVHTADPQDQVPGPVIAVVVPTAAPPVTPVRGRARR